jgi:hypothetical protein
MSEDKDYRITAIKIKNLCYAEDQEQMWNRIILDSIWKRFLWRHYQNKLLKLIGRDCLGFEFDPETLNCSDATGKISKIRGRNYAVKEDQTTI